jgi:ligand-binding sensor domain-containing protein
MGCNSVSGVNCKWDCAILVNDEGGAASVHFRFFGPWPTRVLIALVIVLPCAAALSDPSSGSLLEATTRRIWRMQDGLPDNVITAVAETSEHYLWSGTPRNLVRFDGFHFIDVSSDVAPSIRESGITCLFAASGGSLWIGIGDGTLLQLEGTHVHAYGPASGLRSYDVRALQQDSNGTIWAGTDHGIYRLAGQRFERVPSIGDPSVRAMIQDGHGGLWIGGHRLTHYTNGVFQNVALPKQKMPTRINALAITPDRRLWIGTAGGLLHSDASGSISSAPSISHEVSALLVDRNTKLWIGTVDSGLFLAVPGNRFTPVPEAITGHADTILVLYKDESGDLWLGTHSGLVRLSETGMHLTAIPAARNAEHASLTLDADNSLWICLGKVFHLVNGRVRTVNFPLVGEFLVRTILRSADGSLWIGTAGGGALHLHRRGEPQKYASELGTSYVTGFLEGSNGDVWISTDSGIALWHEGHVISFQHILGAPHQAVLSIADAGSGAVWIATGHGFYLWRNGQFLSDPAISALGDRAIRSLCSWSDGTLWIGTESGLFRWKDHKMLEVPLDDDGSQAVLSILEDPLGQLWLSGPDRVRRIQVAVIDRVLNSMAGYPSAQGTAVAEPLLAEEFHVSTETGAELYGGMLSSSAPDGRGGAWFISDAGPVHIGSDAQETSLAPPPIVLQQVVVDGRTVAISSNLALSLPPSTKTLEIQAPLFSLDLMLGYASDVS